jgi:hypothetical protein
MAMILCPECESRVSDRAPACPQCGCPFEQSARTTEATGKEWKALKLLGWVALLAALILVFNNTIEAGVVVGLGGMGTLIVAKAGGWWHHG